MRLADAAKKIVREPLVHFLLLGAVIFAVFGWRSGQFDSGSKTIVVTQGRIASLANTFSTTFMREPSPQELDGLVRDYVREEAAVREATALGLDRDDQIVRRRLRQKLDFVAQGFTAPPEPSDSQLQAYLTSHPEQFATERRFTFRQVYLDPSRHGAETARDAERVRAELRKEGAKADLRRIGDASVVGNDFSNVSSQDVKFSFGDAFATELAGVAPGQWEGPLRSTFGAHIVFVSARTEAGTPPLARCTTRCAASGWPRSRRRHPTSSTRRSCNATPW